MNSYLGVSAKRPTKNYKWLNELSFLATWHLSRLPRVRSMTSGILVICLRTGYLWPVCTYRGNLYD